MNQIPKYLLLGLGEAVHEFVLLASVGNNGIVLALTVL